MFPPKVIYLPANWTQSRDGQRIQCFIAHDTERPNDNTNSIAYLQRGGDLPDGSDRKVSIHVLIEPNGDIYEMVPDHLGANHAGYGTLTINGQTYCPDCRYSINDCSLGFELEYTKAPYNGPYPEEQLLAMGWWIATKRQLYGNLPIFEHADVDPSRRSDARNLTVTTMESYVTKAQAMINDIPTPSTPKPYRMTVTQVVYQSYSVDAPFAGDPHAPAVLQAGSEQLIGKIESNGWLWLHSGWGFIPPKTAVRI